MEATSESEERTQVSLSISARTGTSKPMTNGLQESRMREICTSGSMRGSDGRGVACNGRPSLSTLLVKIYCMDCRSRATRRFRRGGQVAPPELFALFAIFVVWFSDALAIPEFGFNGYSVPRWPLIRQRTVFQAILVRLLCCAAIHDGCFLDG